MPNVSDTRRRDATVSPSASTYSHSVNRFLTLTLILILIIDLISLVLIVVHIGPFFQTDGEECDYSYELFSVIIHKGGCYGGHYHVYIRDIDQLGQWEPLVRKRTAKRKYFSVCTLRCHFFFVVRRKNANPRVRRKSKRKSRGKCVSQNYKKMTLCLSSPL